VTPESDDDGVQMSATEPENPSFGVTETATTLLVPGVGVTFLELGRRRKCGFGVPLSASSSAVASTDPHPVTRS
jgi:hypothetical protein